MRVVNVLGMYPAFENHEGIIVNVKYDIDDESDEKQDYDADAKKIEWKVRVRFTANEFAKDADGKMADKFMNSMFASQQ